MTEPKPVTVREYLEFNPIVGMHFSIRKEDHNLFYWATDIKKNGRIVATQYDKFKEPVETTFTLKQILHGHQAPKGLIKYLAISQSANLEFTIRNHYPNFDSNEGCDILVSSNNGLLGHYDPSRKEFVHTRPNEFILGYVSVSETGTILPDSFTLEPEKGLHALLANQFLCQAKEAAYVSTKRITHIARRPAE